MFTSTFARTVIYLSIFHRSPYTYPAGWDLVLLPPPVLVCETHNLVDTPINIGPAISQRSARIHPRFEGRGSEGVPGWHRASVAPSTAPCRHNINYIFLCHIAYSQAGHPGWSHVVKSKNYRVSDDH